MIRINLLKDAVRPRAARRKIPKEVLLAAGGVGAVAALVLAGVFIWRAMQMNREPRAVTVEEDLTPSTFTRSNVVEEVVREVQDRDKIAQNGVLQLPYSELTFAEKVNYEIHFARQVFSFLGTCVPPGIEFKRFEAADFKTLYGSGISDSRKLISEMFLAFRNGGAKLLPVPYTKIVRKGDAYQFVLSTEKDFGLDLAAPFVDLGLGHLPSAEDVDEQVRSVREVAGSVDVSFVQPPRRLEVEQTGSARRFKYAFTATSSYGGFVAFVNALYDRRTPCAFEKISLVALTKDKVKIDGRFFFTTLD